SNSTSISSTGTRHPSASICGDQAATTSAPAAIRVPFHPLPRSTVVAVITAVRGRKAHRNAQRTGEKMIFQMSPTSSASSTQEFQDVSTTPAASTAVRLVWLAITSPLIGFEYPAPA